MPMSTFPSKFACRTRTFFTEFKLQGRHLVFGAPSLQIPPDLYLRGVAGVAELAQRNGHQDARPEPTYSAPEPRRRYVAKANSLKKKNTLYIYMCVSYM